MRNVLIVDDESAGREGLARLLASEGFLVRTAADADQATLLMSEQPADILLLDIGLPHVTGDSLATFLRIRYPHARIIFISGQYDMVDPQRFGDQACFLRKPINLPTLLQTLQTPP